MLINILTSHAENDKLIIAILILVILLPVIWMYREVSIMFRVDLAAFRKFKTMQPLIRKFAYNEKVLPSEIAFLVSNPSFRCGIFRLLNTYRHLELFPDEYFTQEKAAESFLVNWLEFPTELGKPPDEIEMVRKINLWSDEELAYYVFKFRIDAPHWAAQYNWMIGVVGPYQNDTSPYQEPLKIFSRFNSIQNVSPEMEVQWVHNNISVNRAIPVAVKAIGHDLR